MRARSILLAGSLLLAAAPAPATVRVYRASGTVASVVGDTSLLPLAAAPGDDLTIELTYDDAAPDIASALPEVGIYPGVACTVTIAGTTLEYQNALGGTSGIQISLGESGDHWSFSACLDPCDLDAAESDGAHVNFYFDPDTLLSDALGAPPDSTGASVQFGLYSSRVDPPGEATVDATLESIVLVPEPGGPLLLGTGALALSASTAPRRRRAPHRPTRCP